MRSHRVRIHNDNDPIAALNITPLIDVMLVLLVMFILIIPTISHKVPVDLPAGGPGLPLEMVTHRLELMRGGTVMLDGEPMDDVRLAGALLQLKDDPAAELTFRTDPEARYERFDQVLAVVKRAGISRLGFVGHERMAQ